jgi:DNA-binding NarL/FixJ family response regulator
MKIKVDVSRLPKVPYSKPTILDVKKTVVSFHREDPVKKKRDWSKVRRGNRSRFYTPEQDEVIREMRRQGKSFEEIGDQLGRSKEAVRRRFYVI